ncbi:Glutathione S-transferase GST-6.0 (plasmid) [Sulfitobacter sp. THAF37]|uniref:glutathione S-transferase family protein n=1 Tax=Sulfitobacter sp. THAF37 TaxID=2587855 RepID=UPI00126968CD|nr:glutathione S-transferase family protein [Sulfitobacter sp. THAF37]QFT60886.1 Glutathione S-transferase GST-6.0 [Sulfitobacter sp. THAF37]
MLTLYFAKGTAALPVHIALEEAGADYDLRQLDFSKNEQTEAAFLDVNPKGRVPALITEKGVLTEAAAILVYIGQTFDAAGLLPADPFELAQAQSFNMYLASTVHVAHAHKQRGARWADDPATIEAMKAKVTQNMTDCAELVETRYLKGPWVMGERYSICDPYLFLMARWLEVDGVDTAAFPGIRAHREMMEARPAVRAVLKYHE